MEYFKYDYKNVKSEFNFKNYENFLTNNRCFKYYLFDLALMRNDPIVPPQEKSKANNIILKQKLLFFLPYPIIGITFLYCNKKNLFQVGMLDKEFKIVFNLFMTLSGIRLLQKGLLKYEGDRVLLEVAKNKNHSV